MRAARTDPTKEKAVTPLHPMQSANAGLCLHNFGYSPEFAAVRRT
jgi:hypothetical protein